MKHTKRPIVDRAWAHVVKTCAAQAVRHGKAEFRLSNFDDRPSMSSLGISDIVGVGVGVIGSFGFLGSSRGQPPEASHV
jgi:hypothetical protein